MRDRGLSVFLHLTDERDEEIAAQSYPLGTSLNELTLTDGDSYNIPASEVGVAITEIDISH